MIEDIAIIVRAGDVFAGIDRLRRINTQKVFRRIRKPAIEDLNDHAAKQAGPDGAWPALASSTLERRARMAKKGRRQKPRRILGRLPGARISRATMRSLTVSSRVKAWSMVHQAGGRAGHGSRIPRRQFMWISAALRQATKREFETELTRVWGRGP